MSLTECYTTDSTVSVHQTDTSGVPAGSGTSAPSPCHPHAPVYKSTPAHTTVYGPPNTAHKTTDGAIVAHINTEYTVPAGAHTYTVST